MSEAIPARTMISFEVGDQRLSHHVAATALRHAHVLVCREDEDDCVMFPGGRLQRKRPSPVALARELLPMWLRGSFGALEGGSRQVVVDEGSRG